MSLVVKSASLAKLTLVLEALHSLLFPLQWNGPCVVWCGVVRCVQRCKAHFCGSTFITHHIFHAACQVLMSSVCVCVCVCV